jgi:isoamylase
VEELRNRQVKNFIALLMLSAGTPMLLMGDEARRTQGGNNNAYCLDDETSWFDWSLLDRHRDVHRFVRALATFRQRRDILEHDTVLSLTQLLEHARLDWHGVKLGHPDWADSSHSVAFTLRSFHRRFLIHVMLNAYWEPLEFEIPPVDQSEEGGWRRCIDTALQSPDDVSQWRDARRHGGWSCTVQPRSLVLLAARLQHRAAAGPGIVS